MNEKIIKAQLADDEQPEFRHLTDAIHPNSVNLSVNNVPLNAQKECKMNDKTNIMTESVT